MESQVSIQRSRKDDLIRGAFMILFLIAERIVSALTIAMTLFQFICALIARKPNAHVARFGGELSSYVAEIIRYLTYNTERKPWPFAPWGETNKWTSIPAEE